MGEGAGREIAATALLEGTVAAIRAPVTMVRACWATTEIIQPALRQRMISPAILSRYLVWIFRITLAC